MNLTSSNEGRVMNSAVGEHEQLYDLVLLIFEFWTRGFIRSWVWRESRSMLGGIGS